METDEVEYETELIYEFKSTTELTDELRTMDLLRQVMDRAGGSLDEASKVRVARWFHDSYIHVR